SLLNKKSCVPANNPHYIYPIIVFSLRQFLLPDKNFFELHKMKDFVVFCPYSDIASSSDGDRLFSLRWIESRAFLLLNKKSCVPANNPHYIYPIIVFSLRQFLLPDKNFF
ncbi:MAG: hypothetical protein WBA93_14630, partial [Microcoleaceae cyanobacterium]